MFLRRSAVHRLAVVAVISAFSALTHAQTSLQSSSPLAVPPRAPEIGKILAQTFSEQDIEMLTGALRDAMQGKPIEPTRLTPLTQKMEGLGLLMLSELVKQGVPMIDRMEGELKKELRRLKEPDAK